MTGLTAATILIAAVPGPLRDALQALMLSLFPEAVILTAGDPEGLLELATRSRPRLVVVIVIRQLGWNDLPGRIREAVPDCRIAILTDGENGWSDADLVMQQGSRPEHLVSALTRLMSNESKETTGGKNG